jgi:hypothetical protein
MFFKNILIRSPYVGRKRLMGIAVRRMRAVAFGDVATAHFTAREYRLRRNGAIAAGCANEF